MVIPAELIRFSPRFQRAVHLRYDLRSSDALSRYIPTQSAADALEAIFRGVFPLATQRSHLLHAAYGSGKSLLAVCIAALFEKPDKLAHENDKLVARLQQLSPSAAKPVANYLHSGPPFLPVVLSGNEGDFASSIIRALTVSIREAKIDVRIPSGYETASQTIRTWETQYPDTYQSFSERLEKRYGCTAEELLDQLEQHDQNAFDRFSFLYSAVTGGAKFNAFFEQSPELIYREVAVQIKDLGYRGIVVLWDEFGRYLEAHANQVFSEQAALLQNFAEVCNYSGDNQIHLLLFTHKEIQSYATNLPRDYQQAWSRIEGRFQRHNIASDPNVAYRLVASAFEYTDPDVIRELVKSLPLAQLARQAEEIDLFPSLDGPSLHNLLLNTFPLHPLTTFALVRLSSRVAQNERTMFTFLTTEEKGSFPEILAKMDLGGNPFIGASVLWDYFAEQIRADTGLGGVHRIWSGVAHALDKVAVDDVFAQNVIKTLGVVLICAESSALRPTTALLSWAVDDDETAVVLEELRRRKVVIHRKFDSYWKFTTGSDFDFERKLQEVLERTNPSPIQLRRLLENAYPTPYTLARRYNQDRAITRYFSGVYRWDHELQDAPWETLIDQSKSDGLVVYILATDEHALETAQRAFQIHDRVVYVFPVRPLSQLLPLLHEVFALFELINDPLLKAHEDKERIQRELDWLLEDAKARLEREVQQLTDPRQRLAVWTRTDTGVAHCVQVTETSFTTKMVSELCELAFPDTPILNSDGLNRQEPTTQQIRASEKVIDALFSGDARDQYYGLEGNGPEILAFNAFLHVTKIIQQHDDHFFADRPEEAKLANIWDRIDTFYQRCQQGPVPISEIIQELSVSPIGLRRGTLPILLAAVMQRYLRVVTVRKGNRTIYPVTGELLAEMVQSPDDFDVEIGDWNQDLENLWQALVESFGIQLNTQDQAQQPLALLPSLMIRWLQGQNAFCRQTKHLSAKALKFRDLVRVAQIEPEKVLFRELPTLLGGSEGASQLEIEQRLRSIMDEVSGAYLNLQRRLDQYAINEFSALEGSGFGALQAWLDQIKHRHNKSIHSLKFGSLIAQDLIETIERTTSDSGQFWDMIASAVTGVHLRDWTDQSETRFYETLNKARLDIEREVDQLVEDDAVVSLQLNMPDNSQHDYRFRAADLSVQGQRILQNLKSTLAIAGRPLSIDEKRQIAVAFLTHVMGDDLGD